MLQLASLLVLSLPVPLTTHPDDGLQGTDFPGAKYPIGLGGSPPEKADLDGDGAMDIVVANGVNAAANLSILYGRGDGTFEPQRELATGNQGTDLAIADVDGDGDLDIVCVALEGDEVTFHRNLGARQFADPVSTPVGDTPVAGDLGDMTGDGLLDLVTARFWDSTLEVRPGDGDGNFGAPSTRSLSSNPSFLDLGDANGDGLIDALVTLTGDGEVAVYLGDGAGGFGAALTLAMGSGVTRALWRDANSDGILDIVSVARNNGNVTVRMGAGNGTFGNRRVRSVGDEPQSVEVADLNGDGQPDFVVTRESTFGQLGGRITTVRGIGGEPTGVLRTFRSGSNPQGVAIHDLDGDGFLDLAATNGIGGDVAVLLGEENGRFDVPEEVDVGLEPRALMTGDFNGDGAADVVVGNDQDANVVTLLGDGEGSFQGTVIVTPTDIEAFGGLASDFNGDGHLDVAVSGRRNFSTETIIAFGDGTGAFTSQQQVGTVQLFEGNFDIADADGDGNMDLFVGATDGFRVSLATGSGSFAFPLHTSSFGMDGSITVADFNLDGNVDVAMPRSGNLEVNVFLGDGAGGFTAGSAFLAGSAHTAIAAGDVNGDGLMDLAYAGRAFPGAARMEVALGDGLGGFAPQGAHLTRRDAREISVADVDLDGHEEVIVSGGGVLVEVEVFQFDSSGSLTALDGYTGGAGWGQHTTADMNGDGNLDIVAANVDSGSITVFLNRAQTRLTTYCDALANSTGEAAVLSSEGSRSLAAADFAITVSSVPANETVVWFSGPMEGLRTLPGGLLCIGGSLTRNSAPLAAGPDGTASLPVDFGGLGLLPGSTRHFQCWYTDPLGVPRAFNFSNALTVLVCP